MRLVESTYVGFKKRAAFLDSDYGEWTAHVYAVCRGGRHPRRAARVRTTTQEQAQARLDAVFSGLVTLVPDSYSGRARKSRFIDRDYGEFEALLSNVLSGRGHPKRASICRNEALTYTPEEISKFTAIASEGKVTFIGPYRGMLHKCRFLDVEFGEFEALPANVIHKRTRHSHAVGQRLKQLTIEIHWKTGAVVPCVASYELAAVRWMNSRQFEYEWQATTFTMPNGRTYRPDAYLPDRDLWIEIKGYWWQRSRVKWDWFHDAYPNSELWDRVKLKELGVLD